MGCQNILKKITNMSKQDGQIIYILTISPLHTVNYRVLSSLDMLNVEDRFRQHIQLSW